MTLALGYIAPILIVLSSLACASGLLLLTSSAIGEQFMPPAGRDMDRYVPGSVLQQAPLEGEAKLSLSDAIALGLRFNLNVEVERYAPMIAQQVSEGAWGAYDPTFASDVGYDSQRTPGTTAINASSTRGQNSETFSTGGETSLNGLVPYLGATLGISYEGSKRLTNLTFQNLSPEYTSELFLDANIPLLRGLADGITQPEDVHNTGFKFEFFRCSPDFRPYLDPAAADDVAIDHRWSHGCRKQTMHGIRVQYQGF